MRSTRHRLRLLRSLSRTGSNNPAVLVATPPASSSSSSTPSSASSNLDTVTPGGSHRQLQHSQQAQSSTLATLPVKKGGPLLSSIINNTHSGTTPTEKTSSVTVVSNNSSASSTSDQNSSSSRCTQLQHFHNRAVNGSTNQNKKEPLCVGKLHHFHQHKKRVCQFHTSTEGHGISKKHNWTHLVIMDPSLHSDMRVKAFDICKAYLHGAWKQIDSRDLILKRVSGGLSNWLYHCSLPLALTPVTNEPTQVLLRFYGQVHGEGALDAIITESVIFTLLSERKLGPKLYGVFPGGRVEEFIPARPLLTRELRDPELSGLIAQKMAQIHGLNIPISKEPSWLWGTMERWMTNIRMNLSKVTISEDHQRDIVQKLIAFNLDDELLWLNKYLATIQSPVVFSHNDLQEGNILIRPEEDEDSVDLVTNDSGQGSPSPALEEKLVLIDFEYCSYNYRGFDLANHFCEWSYNYSIDSHPNFTYRPEDYPSSKETAQFIQQYVETLRKEFRVNFAEADDEFLENSVLFQEDHILREVKAFTLASHFFWSLWAIVNAQVSKIPFGYWEYALCRLETYFSQKNELVKMLSASSSI